MRTQRFLATLGASALVATLVPALPAVAAPQTYTVTKTADTADGTCNAADCSLREAIVAANANAGHDTVIVPAGTYTITIAGAGEDAAATGDLDVTDDVTIIGAGSGSTTVNGGGDGQGGGTTDRVFDLRRGAVGLEGLTITNGDVSGLGGGFHTSGDDPVTVGMDDVVVEDNHATSDGGGAYIDYGAIVTVTGAHFNDNTAASDGGGVFLYHSTLHLEDGSFDGNTAGSNGGAIENEYSQARFWDVDVDGNTARYGGGIYNDYSTLEWWGGSLSGNTADGNGSTAYAGGSYDYESVATYYGITVDGNQATTAGGSAYGGAIYVDYGNTTLHDSPITDTSAQGTSSVYGGAVYLCDGANLEMVDSPISNTTVETTSGTVYGGAISNDCYSRVDLVRSPITNTDVTNTGGGVRGGGIYSYEGAVYQHDGSDVDDTTVSATSTVEGGGVSSQYGSLEVVGSSVSGTMVTTTSNVEGGGIYGYESGVSLTNATVNDNTADTGTSAYGGGVFAEYGGLSIHDSSIDGNTAATSGTSGYGGGVYVYYSGTEIEDSTIDGNTATYKGGGISAYESGVTIRRSSVSDNSAVNPDDTTTNAYGGGIASEDYGQFLLEDVDVMRNSATYQGGGIFLYYAGLVARDTRINDNTVDSTDDTDSAYGGGIFTDGYDSIVLERSQLNGNTAIADNHAYGGGIYNYEYSVTLVDSEMVGNTAETTNGDGTYAAYGGGAHVDDDYSPMLFERSLIADNEAIADGTSDGFGGAVFVESDGNVSIVNSTVSGNSATTSGGAAHLNSFLSVASSTVVANSAGDSGGAFEAGAADTEVRLTGSLLQDNTSPDETCSGPGTFTSSGYNLLDDGDADCSLGTTGDDASQVVALDALADNGGPTNTYALPAGSPAIDAGADACTDISGVGDLTTDQRGAGRPIDGDGDGTAACDVGAYEYAAGVTIVATDAAAAEDGPDTGTFTVTREGMDGDLSVAYTVGGSASAGDYEPLSGTVVIPDGSASATVTVTPVADGAVEGAETVVATLVNTSAYAVGIPGEATVTITDHVGDGNMTRVAGDAREDTAVEVSKRAFDSTDTVVIARMDNFADALAGAPLAAKLGAPILLSRTDALPLVTAAEIGRLGADNAIVLGGAAAISDDVIAELEGLGLEVSRLAGANRFETSRLIALEVGGTEVYVAKGLDGDRPDSAFADALGVSALAAYQQRPIVLVSDESLPDASASALTDLSATSATVIGGEGAIAASVEDAIDDLGVSTSRLFGATRYATSVAIADAAVAAGMTPSNVWLASGVNWPDALAAGPAVGVLGEILLLVHPATLDNSPESRTFLMDNSAVIDLVMFVGGAAALSDQLVTEVQAALA